MVTKDELTTFIKSVPYQSSEQIAIKLLDSYDISEKPLTPVMPGDIFRRVNGNDTIVWSDYSKAFLGVHPRTPNFCRFGNTEDWVLIARYGHAVKDEDKIIIKLNANGTRYK